MNIRIREYQKWSENNMSNHLGFVCRKDETEDMLYLVSDEEVSEMELLGLITIIKRNMNHWRGLDIYTTIFKARYNEEKDYINAIYIDYEYRLNNNFYIPSVENASKNLLLHQKEQGLLSGQKYIIGVYFKIDRRFKKSKWWRFCNRRKAELNVCL